MRMIRMMIDWLVDLSIGRLLKCWCVSFSWRASAIGCLDSNLLLTYTVFGHKGAKGVAGAVTCPSMYTTYLYDSYVEIQKKLPQKD